MSKKTEIESKTRVDLKFTTTDDGTYVSSVHLDKATEYGFITKNALRAERIYTFGVD